MSSKEYPYSGWRKPLDVNEANPRAKYTLLGMEFVTLKLFDILNVVLCGLILLGIVKLVFFTTYERTVLVDGTELSCLLQEDGSVVPYIPPRAPSVPMPKQPLINEGPLVAPLAQNAQGAADLGFSKPATPSTSLSTTAQNASVPSTAMSGTMASSAEAASSYVPSHAQDAMNAQQAQATPSISAQAVQATQQVAMSAQTQPSGIQGQQPQQVAPAQQVVPATQNTVKAHASAGISSHSTQPPITPPTPPQVEE